jgi:membrane protein YdbS with pleckstrin-like domain
MGKFDKHLAENEKIYIEGGAHTVVHLPAIVCFGLTMMFVLPFAVQHNPDDPSSGMLLLALSAIFFAAMVFFVILGLLLRGAKLYAITNRRVLIKNAIFQRELTEIPLPKVENISMEQGSLGKVFNFGTLVVSQKQGEKEIVSLISRPDKIVDISNQVMERFAKAYEQMKQKAGQ